MSLKPFILLLLTHIAPHTFWCLTYILSLCGCFALIPFIGLYNAFVLGFLGNAVLASATQAALIGYLVFSVTGLISYCAIAFLRPRLLWRAALFSLGITYLLLISATWARYRYIGPSEILPLLHFPATTDRSDIAELSMALKT